MLTKLKNMLLSCAPVRKILFRIRNVVNYLSGKPEGRGVILMLHRVGNWEEGKLIQNENMKVSPKRLEDFILRHRKTYDFIRLEDVPERLKCPQKKKFMVFTMDDGYKDNLTEALPVFQKYNVPFTIFITTDFPDGQASLWWYVLENLLLTHDRIELADKSVYPADTMENKTNSFTLLRTRILQLNQTNFREEFETLFAGYSIDWQALCRDLCLSWNDIQQLKNEHLVTLGAHTQHHLNLKQLPSAADVRTEVLNGCRIMEEKGGLHPIVFAYPFGSPQEAGEREFEVLSGLSEKFKLAVTACGGPVSGQRSSYAIERLMLTESFDEDSLRFSKWVYTRPFFSR